MTVVIKLKVHRRRGYQSRVAEDIWKIMKLALAEGVGTDKGRWR